MNHATHKILDPLSWPGSVGVLLRGNSLPLVPPPGHPASRMCIIGLKCSVMHDKLLRIIVWRLLYALSLHNWSYSISLNQNASPFVPTYLVTSPNAHRLHLSDRSPSDASATPCREKGVPPSGLRYCFIMRTRAHVSHLAC